MPFSAKAYEKETVLRRRVSMLETGLKKMQLRHMIELMLAEKKIEELEEEFELYKLSPQYQEDLLINEQNKINIHENNKKRRRVKY